MDGKVDADKFSRAHPARKPSRNGSCTDIEVNGNGFGRIKKVSEACSRCKLKKIKCDGHRPQCGRCRVLAERCEYINIDRRKRESKDAYRQNMRRRIQHLESTLRFFSQQDAGFDANKQTVPDTATETSKVIVDVRSEPNSRITATFPTGREDPSIPPVRYDTQRFPPKALLQKALDDFKSGTYGIVFVASDEYLTLLVDTVDTEGHAADIVHLTQLCAICALGCYYSSLDDSLPDDFRERAFQTAKANLWETVDRNVGAGLRVLICISLICLFEKRLSLARVFIASGLQIARDQVQKAQGQHSQCQSLHSLSNLYQTISILDSWLVLTTGTGETQVLDMDRRELTCLEPYLDVFGRLQSQIGTISTLICQALAEVFADVHADCTTRSDIAGRHLQIILQWREHLAPDMLLSAAHMTVDMPLEKRRAILVIHLMYLGGVLSLGIILMEAMWDDLAQSGKEVDEIGRLTEKHHEGSFSAAQSLARLIGLLLGQPRVSFQCPTLIFDSYLSAGVLVYKSWIDLSRKSWRSLDEDFYYVERTVENLRLTGIHDHVAAGYHGKIKGEAEALERACVRAIANSPDIDLAASDYSHLKALVARYPSEMLEEQRKDSDTEETFVPIEILKEISGNSLKPAMKRPSLDIFRAPGTFWIS